MLLLLALSACAPASPDIHEDTGAADDSGLAPDTADETGAADTSPVDLDGDGFAEGEDCDDRAPAVNPGAQALWNELDDDCDGVIDADGAWSGEITLEATAVYEGRPYSFRLDCPVEGARAHGDLQFAVTCTPDPADEDAQRLLGATLTIRSDEPMVSGDFWADTVVLESSNGWDSDGEGTVQWIDFDSADLSFSMAGVSLQASGGGRLQRD